MKLDRIYSRLAVTFLLAAGLAALMAVFGVADEDRSAAWWSSFVLATIGAATYIVARARLQKNS